MKDEKEPDKERSSVVRVHVNISCGEGVVEEDQEGR